MLINKGHINLAPHVRFVGYTGRWPNLCGGTLTLDIDGKTERFGNEFNSEKPEHPKFWKPCGGCSMDVDDRDEWAVDVGQLPEKFRKYAMEIDRVFNENVEHGRCGGCK